MFITEIFVSFTLVMYFRKMKQMFLRKEKSMVSFSVHEKNIGYRRQEFGDGSGLPHNKRKVPEILPFTAI